jgi:beta-glucosidase
MYTSTAEAARPTRGMRRQNSLCRLVTLIFATLALAGVAADSSSRRVDELLARMTIEEKIGQTVLLTGYGATTGPVPEQSALEDYIRKGECGNVFNVLGVAQIRRLQKIAVEETRLHIPLLFGFDTIHGYRTIFPISLGESASWNLQLIEDAARVAAIECSAAGLNWTFAPMVDIARDPRWGRISESAGEDPYFGSLVAQARVRGFQGTNLAAPDTVLACVKHYAAYGAAQAGRDYHTVDLSERTLREVYLPPYRAALEAGALSVMTSFNELNGTPATANDFLLKQILRDEWGFKGFVVTDYTSINEMVAHGSARDEAEAGGQALRAGVDMDMQGHVYRKHLKQLLAKGEIIEAQITTAAKRVLEIKFQLGLFDDPYRYCDEQREQRLLLTKEHRETAYRMACESFVLLKNDHQTLPLKPGSKIAVIGPLADARHDLLGSWLGTGISEGIETILGGIRRNNGSGPVTFAHGCEVMSTNRTGFAEAIKAARTADLAVLVLGEHGHMSGEAKSRTSINLPGGQTELLREIKKLGKPVIVVLLNGRPLALEEEATLADALLETWFPGTEGGRAVADVLFGKQSPAGKLPATFPRNPGQVPIFYSVKNTGRPLNPARPKEEYKSSYLDAPNDPLFPFGFGLSYTAFAFSEVELDRPRLKSGEALTATVTVTNTGKRAGTEVVQLYLRDLIGSVTRPLSELKGFQKLELQPGESRTLSFKVGEAELRFLRADMTWGTEPGEFQVLIGPNSRDLNQARFELLGE